MNQRVAGWAAVPLLALTGCGILIGGGDPMSDEERRRRLAEDVVETVSEVERDRSEVMNATFKELDGVYELLKAFHEWDKAVGIMVAAMPGAMSGKSEELAVWSDCKVQVDAAREKIQLMTKSRGDGKEFKAAMDKGRTIQSKLTSLRERARKELE